MRALPWLTALALSAAVPAQANLLDWAKKQAKKVESTVTGVAKRLEATLTRIGNKVIGFAKPAFTTAEQLWREVANLRLPLVGRWGTSHARVDLSARQRALGIPVKDQGATTTCMAQALSTALEYATIPYLEADPVLARRAGLATARGLTLSRRHIYYLSRHGLRVCSDATRMTGSWAGQAASWLRSQGTFLEALWPFQVWNAHDTTKYRSCLEAATNGLPPRGALAQRHFFVDRFYYLPGVPLPDKASVRRAGDVKAILAQGYPVVVSVFTWGGHEWSVDPRNPVVGLPKGGLPDNAHYVALLGYDDARRAFLFVNSWGKDWGQGGYGWLPYAYLERYGIEGLFIRSVSIR